MSEENYCLMGINQYSGELMYLAQGPRTSRFGVQFSSALFTICKVYLKYVLTVGMLHGILGALEQHIDKTKIQKIGTPFAKMILLMIKKINLIF